ncbi:membrane protein [Clostridium botulinum]|uniref:Membrane protein n=2 Tax=Clostridium botulinum TaxID=1491 RepID=A0A9Q1UWZ2_CLOBO|nr:membrane associated protein [Clostridium botulinum BKT015925]KEI02442.1 membrane protein [Clostridium botulinum C/D str. Sp77]KOA77699.1 membrane protein [Clostridium botulinum]MCD3198313.1 hypothetical protein [Clostridium botulinum C/D]KOA82309.1 membrane protein [Clostridium botulinum]
MFIMYIFIITTIALILLIIILLALIPFKIYFNANSYNVFNFNILFSWLNELLNGKIVCDNTGTLTLNIYFYNKLVKTKPLTFNKSQNKSNSNKLTVIKNLKVEFIDIKTFYGFKDPSITGMICGLINLIPCFSDKNHIINYPNFNSDITYFNTSGKIHLNLLYTLTQILKNKFNMSSNNISYANK